jgi:hypothetical protein
VTKGGWNVGGTRKLGKTDPRGEDVKEGKGKKKVWSREPNGSSKKVGREFRENNS